MKDSNPFPRHPADCASCLKLIERSREKRRHDAEQVLLARQIIAAQRERLEAIAERAQEPHPLTEHAPMAALVTLDGDLSTGTLTITRPKRKRAKKVDPMPEA